MTHSTIVIQAVAQTAMPYAEVRSINDELNTMERKVYLYLVETSNHHSEDEEFTTEHIAEWLEVAEGTIENAKTGLRKKGFAVFTPDRIVIGKPMVKLYNQGVRCGLIEQRTFNALATDLATVLPLTTIDIHHVLRNNPDYTMTFEQLQEQLSKERDDLFTVGIATSNWGLDDAQTEISQNIPLFFILLWLAEHYPSSVEDFVVHAETLSFDDNKQLFDDVMYYMNDPDKMHPAIVAATDERAYYRGPAIDFE